MDNNDNNEVKFQFTNTQKEPPPIRFKVILAISNTREAVEPDEMPAELFRLDEMP